MATTKPVVEFSKGVWEYVNGSTIQYIGIVDGKKTVLAKLTNLVNIAEGDAAELTEGEKTFSYKKVNVIDTETNTAAELNDEIDFSPTEEYDKEDTSLVTSYSGVMTLNSHILSTAKKPTLTQTKNYNFTMDVEADSKVQIATTSTGADEKTTEKLVYDAKNGKITVVASLTAGYTVAKDGKSAEYFSFAPNVTLATITGLNKNFDEDSKTATLSDVNSVSSANEETGLKEGLITLSQVDTTSEETKDKTGVLGTSAIKITNDKLATNNGFNYYLALGNDYAQEELNEYTPYWELNKTTATYKVDTPTGYVLHTAEAEMDTQIDVQKAFTTTIATVTGLAEDLEVAENKFSVGKTVDNNYTAYLEAEVKEQPTLDGIGGKLVVTKEDGVVADTGKGEVSVTVADGALPSKGTLKVAPGNFYDAETDWNASGKDALKVDTDPKTFATLQQENEDPLTYANIWVVKGDTATYKKVQLAYYNTFTPNQATYVAQKDIMTLVTVKGLNADYLADTSHFKYENIDDSSVITSIEGLTFGTNGPDAEYIDVNKDDETKKASWKWVKTDTVDTLTVGQDLVGEKNITINKSENAILSIDANLAPKFSNLNWNGASTAILKGDIEAGYTSSDDGKTITYTKAATNATLATVSGLSKNTTIKVATVEGGGEYRSVGTGSGEDFKQGLTESTEALSYGNADETTGVKKLEKLAIKVSANVLDTAKVSIKSDFYKLAIDDGTASSAVTGIITGGKVVQKDDIAEAADGATELAKYITVSGTTATYKQGIRPYYSIDDAGTAISYQKETSVTNIATITGINKNTNIDIYAGIDEDDNDIYVDGNNNITINEGALSEATIKLSMAVANKLPEDEKTKEYKLALGKDSEGEALETGGLTWRQDKDKVYLDAAPGYELSGDGLSVVYTGTGKTTNIATISGLAAGIVQSALEKLNEELAAGTTPYTAVPVNEGNEIGGITLDKEKGTITLGLSALNNAAVALTGTGNYKLLVKDIGDDEVPTKPSENANANWVVSGSNAIYKKVFTSYYDYNAEKNTLTFKAAKDATGDAAKVYASVKGLAKDLVANPKDATELGKYVDGDFVAAVKIDTTDADKPAVTIVNALALGGSNITIDKTTPNATIAIDEDTDDDDLKAKMKATSNSATWTVDTKGTATYKGNIDEYYTNDTNGITYHKPVTNGTAAIATITGLKSSLNATTLAELVPSDEGVITLKSSMLDGSKDVKLTTSINLLEENDGTSINYKFELATGYDSIATFDELEKGDDYHAGWNIGTKTATYGVITEKAFYDFNNGPDEPTDELIYNGPGFAESRKEFELSGDGLNVKELETWEDLLTGTIDVDSSSKTVTVSSAAIVDGKDIKLTSFGEDTYSFDATAIAPKNSYTCKTEGGGTTNTDVKIYTAKTAGYTAEEAITDSDGNTTQTLKYNEATTAPSKFDAEKNKLIATIKGLNPTGITVNSDGTIDGIKIDIDGSTITLSKAVLGTSEVSVTEDSGTNGVNYTLALDSDVPIYSADSGSGFKLIDGVLNFYANCATEGYTLNNNKITYTAVGSLDTPVAKITGLKVSALKSSGTAITAGEFLSAEAIDGISVSGTTITLSKNVLGTDEVKFDYTTDYTFALAKEGDDKVPSTDNTALWSFNQSKGEATYTESVVEGYKLGTDNKSITYTPASTITSTFTNLNKNDGAITVTEVTDSEDGNKIQNSNGDDAITFEDGVFTFADEGILASKTVKLTVKASKGPAPDYKIELDDDGFKAAEKQDFKWNKTATDTKATLTQTTNSGYSLAFGGKEITYSSDPVTTTLATITGLKKDVAAATNTSASGDGTDYATTIAGLSVTTKPVGTTPGVIKISKSILTTSDVKLASGDNYKFVLDDGEGINDETEKAAVVVPTKPAEGTKNPIWEVSSGKVMRKEVTPAYYAFKTTNNVEDPKTIVYNKPGTADPLFTITGLNKNAITPDVDGNITGLTYDATSKTVTLSSALLGTSDIKIDGDYQLALKSDDTAIIKHTDTTNWENQTEWTASGTTYTYKTYNKTNWEEVPTESKGVQTIKYYAEKTDNKNVYAKITNLAEGQIDKFNAETGSVFSGDTTGGTITLDADMLNEKQIKLDTKGDFTLKLASDLDDSLVSTVTEDGWTTNKTTATLKGTIGAGYATTEDGKIVNYYNADKTGQTIATISGIASGAKIDNTDDDTYVKDSTTGVTTITLGKSQLDTSKVTIKGDYYQLAVDDDEDSPEYAASKEVAPKWVKAANATKATYTKTVSKGFTVADAGKTLNYNSKNTNIDLATLSGLTKELTVDQMTDDSTNASALVTLATVEGGAGTITLKKAAMGANNITLGNKDEFNLALDSTEETANEFKAGMPVADHLTFKNGTASIVNGETEGWTETNGKLITYTKAKENVVSTITGLDKNLGYDSTTASIAGFTFTAGGADSLVTIGKTALEGTKTVTLKNNANANNGYTAYKLQFATAADESVAAVGADTNATRWTVSGTAATLESLTSAGYTLSNDTLITYSADAKSGDLAKITGLPKGVKLVEGVVKDANNNNVINKTDDNKIEFTSDFIKGVESLTAETTLELTSTDYTFATNSTSTQSPDNAALNTGTLSTKGTVTLDQHVNGTWTYNGTSNSAQTNITKLAYTPAQDKTYITISGLNKTSNGGNSDLSYGGTGTADSLNVTVGAGALTSSKVTITKSKGVTDAYKLVLDAGVNSTMTTSTAVSNGNWSVQGSGWKDQTEWITSGGTATYKLYDKENWYTQDDTKNNTNSIIYVAPTKGTAFAAISGLLKTASLSSDAGVTNYSNATGGAITLTGAQLGTSKVQLKITPAKNASSLAAIDTGNSIASGFELALGSDFTSSLSTVEDGYWDTTGTTAKLTGNTTEGYVLSTDKMTVTYEKAKTNAVVATVTGLKTGGTITKADVSATKTVNGGLITEISLGSGQLGTSNLAVKGEGYKFVFKDEVVTTDKTDKWENQTEWVASGGTFTYKTYDKEHYEFSNTARTAVKYIKAADDTKNKPDIHKTYAVVSGLSKTVPAGTSTAIDSLDAASSKTVITLNSDVLNKAKVTLTDKTGDGYTLALGNDTDKSAVSDKAAAISGTKVTWTGTKGIGYAVANDAQSIEYFSAAKTKQTVAQVTGAAASATSVTGAAETFTGKYNEETNAVTFSDGDLSTVVGISGTAEFNFGSYDNGSITGSSAADKVSIAGSGVSINAGAGNDYVDFDGGSGNIFIYAVGGNGNDVIANFGSNKIQITGNISAASIISAAANNGDAVVNVNKKGTIRLKGLASSVGSLNIVDKNGDAISYSGKTATANVLADDNFETTPQLSSIVKGSASTYAAEDLVATDATSLTKKSSAIAYSGSSKK